jgi:NAD(P)-dependent dehydrogenase (short-subunit alcohol dehydrogenase family)
MQFGVNHLAHFLLTNLLLDIVKKSAPSRIVALSSALQGPIQWDDLNAEKSYSPRGRYGMSKLATILFVKELQRRLDEDGADVVAHSLHPGVIRTNLQQHFPLFFKALFSLMRPFLKTPEQGAATTIYAAIHPQTKAHGLYYEDCAIAKPNKHALNDEDAKRLWGISEDMVDLKQALIELQGDSKLNEKKKNKKSNKSSKNTQISSSTSSGSE